MKRNPLPFKRVLTLSIGSFLLGNAMPLLSEEFPALSAAPTADLGTYVVTGTRTQKLLLDSPVKIEVITRDEILHKNARDLSEAIQDVPGIVLRKIHGKSGYGAWMQGVDAKRVLILIDSEPAAQSTNRITDLTQIGVMNIEQIEIVKGATSALYGSGAIGGVINVITRPNTSPLSYSLKADVGSHLKQNIDGNRASVSTRSSAGQITFNQGEWDGEANFDLRDTDGFTVGRNVWDREGFEGSKVNGELELGYNRSSTERFFLSTNIYEETVDSRYFSTGPTPLPYLKTEEAVRYGYKGGWSTLHQDYGEISLRFMGESFEDTTTQDVANTAELEQYREAKHRHQQINGQWNTDLSEDVVQTIGFVIEPESIDQYQWKLNDDGDRIYSQEIEPGAKALRKTLFIQEDMFIGERLELLPGIRFQHDSDFGRYISPKINGRFQLDAVEGHTSFLRFGYGRGYRVPTLKERYYEFDHSQHGYKVLGNPDTTPEFSNSMQLGWVFQKPGEYYVDINYFRNNLKDLIEPLPSRFEGGIQIFEYGNIAKAVAEGFELASRFNLGEQFNMAPGYTYLEAKDTLTGNRLPKRPRHQAKASLSFQPANSGLRLTLSGTWETSSYFDTENTQDSPEHSVFDFKASYRLYDSIGLYAGIDNFTNTQRDYDDSHDLRPEAGRYVYVGIRLDHE